VPDKQRRPDIGNLISAASSDIQPIKRGAGLSGMIGGQRTPAEADERAQAPDAPPTRAEETAAPARSEHAQPSAPPAPRERRAPATRAPRAAGERRSEATASTSRSTQRAIDTVRRRESAAESVTRQNKTFRLLPELARHIAVAAAERGIFEYSIIETAVEQFLAKRVPPTVTRPRDNAEMARRVRKSYSLRADIVRDIAVMSATWGVFEYEIIEGAVTQYLPLSSRSV
jgi:hypothetical protein